MSDCPELPVVLVIASDALQRDLMILALRRGPFHPVACADPFAIRALIDQFNPAVILIDLFLPGASGLDLLRELNAEARLAGRRVVAVSSLGYPEMITQAVRAGAHDFLLKPISPDLLRERILPR